jgi:dihydropteroate synthase
MNRELILRGQTFVWGSRTYIMGILNVTPDSFSDGGEFHALDAAVMQAKAMVSQGADIIDLGGQSTRPGAAQISVAEELGRVVPVVETLRAEMPEIIMSVDTTRAKVAEAAIQAGADLINDISGAIFDPQMLAVTAQQSVPIVLMHLRGTPQTMQTLTHYQDVVGEVYKFLEARIEAALAMGVARSRLIIDPGIGFAKTADQNLELLRNLPQFQALDVPLLLGVSRKSFIGRILNQNEPKKRVWGTAGAVAGAIAIRGADIVRVHDVAPMYDVCRVADIIYRDGTYREI